MSKSVVRSSYRQMKRPSLVIPVERIEGRICYFRGVRVMLSPDLAELYGVEVKALNQSVKRNIDRFPEDFMFQLTQEEFNDLKSQIVTSSWGGMRRALPYAFTQTLNRSASDQEH